MTFFFLFIVWTRNVIILRLFYISIFFSHLHIFRSRETKGNVEGEKKRVFFSLSLRIFVSLIYRRKLYHISIIYMQAFFFVYVSNIHIQKHVYLPFFLYSGKSIKSHDKLRLLIQNLFHRMRPLLRRLSTDPSHQCCCF